MPAPEKPNPAWPLIEEMTDEEFDRFHDFLMDEIYRCTGKSLSEWSEEWEITEGRD